MVGQQRSRGSTPGRVKGFFCPPDRVDRLWDKSNLLFNGYQGAFPAFKRQGHGTALSR